MRRRTRVLAAVVLAVMLILAVAVGVSATTGTKNISAIFRNIHIVANGKVVQTDTEPFIVNGRTFVPLRAVSEALGAWVDWNQATSMVTIKGGTNTAEVEALKAQIAAKDAEIAKLKAQVDDKDKKGSLSALEKELKRDYDELRDVEIDKISLTGDEDKVTVTIEVDLDDFDREWKKLTDSQIKNWLVKISSDIQDYYDDDTDISGKIRDIDSKDTLVTFSKDGRKSLSVSFKDSKYRGGSDLDVDDVEKDLKGDTYRMGGVNFEITMINYRTSSRTIEVELTAQDSNSRVKWTTLTNSKRRSEVENVCEDLVEEFGKADVDPRYVDITLFDDFDDEMDDYEYDVRNGKFI